MHKIENFIGKNSNIVVLDQKGCFTVIEHQSDLSVTPHTAEIAYYMANMNVCKRQVVISLKDNTVRLAPGAMQMMVGKVESNTGIQGVGDLAGKFIKSKMTGDAAIKPLYKGNGIITTEPIYMYPIIEDVKEWGGIVCDDGMFLCCDGDVKDTVAARANFSSAVAGNEGLFNLKLVGKGNAVLKSRCPREELYTIVLDDDVVKIDGNNAVCWSAGLDFTVERSSRSLVGSAANGEGLVNVYRGTGKILVAPV